MATSNFDANNSAISYTGPWGDGYQASASCRYVPSQYATFDFSATGTACTINVAVGSLSSLTITASVDGGAFSNLTLPGSTNTYSSVTVFTGLSDASHSVTIRLVGTNANMFYLAATSAISVTGASPALTANSTFSGMTFYNVADLLPLGVEGDWGLTQVSGFSLGYQRPACLLAKTPDASMRFRSNATTIRVFAQINNTWVKIYQDGVAVGSKTRLLAANTNPAVTINTMGWVTLATGLDGSWHDYTIVECDTGGAVIAGVGTIGGTIDLSSTGVYPRRGAIVGIGDNIISGQSGTSADSTLGVLWKLGLATNRPVHNGGIDSSTLMGASGTPGTEFRYTDGTGYAALGNSTVDYVLVCVGINDINVASPVPTTNFQKSYQNMLTGIRKSVGPNTKILALGMLPTTTTNGGANRSTYNTSISAAVTAVSDANTSYISTDTLWGTGGSPPTSTQINANVNGDGLNPTATGYDGLVSLLQPYITTWSPPATGGVVNFAY